VARLAGEADAAARLIEAVAGRVPIAGGCSGAPGGVDGKDPVSSAALPLSGSYRAAAKRSHDADLELGLGGKMAENRDDDPETEEQRRERRR
jgi:hypothetical protein